MCRLILTAGLCLIIASLAWTTSATCTYGCATGFCDGRVNGNYIYTDDPNKFYMCSNGLTYIYTCQQGLIYKAGCNCCDDPKNQTPVTTVNPDLDPFCKTKASGLYCYPADPRKFYHCSNGLTYIKVCPSNLVFNQGISNCVFP